MGSATAESLEKVDGRNKREVYATVGSTTAESLEKGDGGERREGDNGEGRAAR